MESNLYCTCFLYALMNPYRPGSRNERKETVSKAVISKGIEALTKHYSTQEKIKLDRSKTKAIIACMCIVEKEYRSKSDYKTQDNVKKKRKTSLRRQEVAGG